MNNVSIRRALAAVLLAILLAPAVVVAGGRGESHGHDAMSDDLSINDAWIRASVAGDENGAAYMIVRNRSGKTVQLVAARSDLARAVELHTHTRVDGLMRMMEVPSIEVPAGGETAFGPGGLHIMLLGINAPLVAGDRHTIVLDFEGHGSVEATFTVQPVGFRGGAVHGGS